MFSRVAALLAMLLFVAAVSACRAEPAGDHQAVSPDRTLAGQLLLPDGIGSRGVEILVTVTELEAEPRTEWVLFDEQGRFTLTFQGSLTSLKVTAGVGAEVHRIDIGDLPEANQAGEIAVGVIDLRDRLRRHRLRLRAADGKQTGDVKVALFFGLPPIGPGGLRVSLGSRQFPAVSLGSEVEWLLSHEAQSMYFLVERPDGSGRGTNWRSGHQRLFGPFAVGELPAELVMD